MSGVPFWDEGDESLLEDLGKTDTNDKSSFKSNKKRKG